ncbi:MAG: site-specific DNA-methyltransferase [Thermoplasmata archaeon]
MKYIKTKEFKETRIRLKPEIYEKLKEISFETDESINLLINRILEEKIIKEENSFEKTDFFKEKANLVYQRYNLEIFNNDFILADLSKYEGKINLLITSPPYNLSLNYQTYKDDIDYEAYLNFTKRWLEKAYILLANDGRICVNIPLDKNKNGLRPVYADFIKIAETVGFKYQSSIVWNEQNISKRTAWGSWLSASAPYVIAPVEMIVVMYKNQWKRISKGITTISKEEFISWTNGLWTFSGESKKKIGHPAPFPIELPKRCIRMFSYKDDVILDPFLGSGTTLVASLQEGRKAVGVEIDSSYISIAINRIEKTANLIK